MIHVKTRVLIFACAAALILTPDKAAAQDETYLSQLAGLDISGLMAQEVVSVLRKEQPVLTSPSAIFVLTSEDIRRSGARNIPQALRLVPEVNVTRTNSNSWSVTIRGVDSDGSAKLLVLIDGRSVYSPLLTGVFWDVQDLMLEDVERIEVIRGPGAVSWGENAVNGVINIITKSSHETQGGLITGGGGKEEQGFGSVRYGGKIGDDTSYRIYSKYDLRDSFKESGGADAGDEWQMARGGFRIDSDVSDKDLVTWQGDLYGGDSNQRSELWVLDDPPFNVRQKWDNDLAGGNSLLRWEREISSTSKTKLQTYYDRTERDIDGVGSEDRDTYDVDFQHQWDAAEDHSLVWGANFRVTSADLGESRNLQFDTLTHTDWLASIFIQDDITIVDNTFRLIPGTKFGYNDLSGIEVQPSIRFVYTPSKSDAVWGAVSRAVRSPALVDHIIRLNTNPEVLPTGQPVIGSLFGDRNFEGEDLMAYELGYRNELSPELSVDLTTFFHHYENLLSGEPLPGFFEQDPLPPHLVMPFSVGNGLNGNTYGGAAYTRWKAFENLEIAGWYSLAVVDYYNDSDSLDTLSAAVDTRTPQHQANLTAHVDLPYDFEFDSMLYYKDSVSGDDVNSHIRTDLKLGWKAAKNLQFDAVVQDLFDGRHREGAGRVEVERVIYGKVTIKFD